VSAVARAPAEPGSELARARIQAHFVFDPIWQNGSMSRTAAYKWLAEKLGIPVEACHMQMMDVAMCDRVIAACSEVQVEFQPGRLVTNAQVEKFCLAGNATITLRSAKTEKRWTYRIRKAEDKDDWWWVDILKGEDNGRDFGYIGQIRGSVTPRYARGRKCWESFHAASDAFEWAWRHVVEREVLPPGLEVWHEGRCGRCARKLTVPESIESGFGPECIQHV
jgi:hypothetical protein